MTTIELSWEDRRAIIAVPREKALPSMLEHPNHLERQLKLHPPDEAPVTLHLTSGGGGMRRRRVHGALIARTAAQRNLSHARAPGTNNGVGA